jgi:acetyl-CoA carboxylase biotin carboxyl carrier protein
LAAPAEKAVKPAETGTLITSPFVGTFYRAPAPESPAFTDVGQTVRKGQVVCIVEAMKLMNEIESEFDGKVVEILVKNSEHVEYGQPLFRIEKA